MTSSTFGPFGSGEPEAPPTIPVKEWSTPWSNGVRLGGPVAQILPDCFAALLPAPQPGHHAPDERVLYSNEHGLYTQRTDGIITFPDVALDAETDDSIAIRCWVVQETRVNAAPMIVLILDRLLRFNGIPYTLENLAEHDAWLRSFSCRLCSPNPDLAFNVLCRFAASSTLQLWKIAEEVVPHMSMGIRFEQPNMSTCATDRIWIASDPTAHPIEVIADVATGAVKCAITDDNHVSDMIRADARLVTGSDCFTHQKLVAYSNAVQSASYGICQNGDVYTATQAALHAAVTLRH